MAPAEPSTSTLNVGAKDDETSVFNAESHLAYTPPAKIFSMQDLSLAPSPISSVATAEPFPLLSHEAVLQHRRELFSPPVLDHCMEYTRPGSVQLRGMAPRYAPFIHSFWHSEEVLRIVSDLAGVDLVPAMDYEICHTNVQLDKDERTPVKQKLAALRRTPVEPPEASEETVERHQREVELEKKGITNTTDQSKPVIEWHRDSHPWVCVVMLSDARFMLGGETELLKGDGTTMKVRAPQMVGISSPCAFIAQNWFRKTDLSCHLHLRVAPFFFKVDASPIQRPQLLTCPNASP